MLQEDEQKMSRGTIKEVPVKYNGRSTNYAWRVLLCIGDKEERFLLSVRVFLMCKYSEERYRQLSELCVLYENISRGELPRRS